MLSNIKFVIDFLDMPRKNKRLTYLQMGLKSYDPELDTLDTKYSLVFFFAKRTTLHQPILVLHIDGILYLGY